MTPLDLLRLRQIADDLAHGRIDTELASRLDRLTEALGLYQGRTGTRAFQHVLDTVNDSVAAFAQEGDPAREPSIAQLALAIGIVIGWEFSHQGGDI